MTVWDTVSAIRRRWYVLVLGILCTGLALLSLRFQEPVYYSRGTAYFLAPASEIYPNRLQTTSLDLVVTAGVVAKKINGTALTTKTASWQVTLVGRGIYDGTMIKLPDNGGQWSNSFDTQALDVQVAAPTPQEVRARQAVIFKRITDELKTIQDAARVPTVDRINIEVPATPIILQMTGERRRAQVMITALGGALTLLIIGMIERRSRHRVRAMRATAGDKGSIQ